MIIRIHISTIHKIQTTSMKRSMRNKRHTFDSSFRSKQHRVAPILDALISLNPGRTSNSINRISRVIGKHWSIIVWSSIEQTTIVRNEKRKKEKYRMILDTVLQWSIVSTVRTCYTHWTHSNEVCFSNGFSLPRPYTHKVHFPRMYLARLPFELRDGISSIYIYIHTPGIKASLHLWLSFTDRLTDCTGPQYIALTFRMKRHIPWSGEWYYGAGNESTRSGGENLLFNRFCVKSK